MTDQGVAAMRIEMQPPMGGFFDEGSMDQIVAWIAETGPLPWVVAVLTGVWAIIRWLISRIDRAADKLSLEIRGVSDRLSGFIESTARTYATHGDVAASEGRLERRMSELEGRTASDLEALYQHLGEKRWRCGPAPAPKTQHAARPGGVFDSGDSNDPMRP